MSDSDLSQQSDTPTEDYVYVVKDVRQILIWMGISAGSAYVCYEFFFRDASNDMALRIIPWVIPIFAFLRLKAVMGGVVFRSAEYTMEFPGGGVSANDVADIIRPSYLLQAFLRYR